MPLVLERKHLQSVWITDHIKVTLIRRDSKCYLSIEAPEDIKISRDHPPSEHRKGFPSWSKR